MVFDGLSLIKDKLVTIVTTLSRNSANELERLIDMANSLGYRWSFNLLDNQLYFFKERDLGNLWPEGQDIEQIVKVLRNQLKLPAYRLDYVRQYYKREVPKEPSCYMGFLEVMIASNGDVLSGCYVLPPVGNVLEQDLEDILKSKEYREAAVRMVRRKCPGCACGVFWNLRIENAHRLLFTGSRG